MSEPTACLLCEGILNTRVERSRRVCDGCAAKTGVVVQQPSPRTRTPCAKCQFTQFIRAVPREIAGNAAGPMFAAHQIEADYGVVEPLDVRRGFGVLEAFICKRCGFVEWYCQDPLEIPIGPEYMTEEVDVGGFR